MVDAYQSKPRETFIDRFASFFGQEAAQEVLREHARNPSIHITEIAYRVNSRGDAALYKEMDSLLHTRFGSIDDDEITFG